MRIVKNSTKGYIKHLLLGTQKNRDTQSSLGFFGGRGGGIRTPDPLLPKQMR